MITPEQEAEQRQIMAPLKTVTDKEAQSLLNYFQGALRYHALKTGPEAQFARDLIDGALDWLGELRADDSTRKERAA